MKTGHWIVLFNSHGSRLPWKLGTWLYYLIHMDPECYEKLHYFKSTFTWIKTDTKSCINLDRLWSFTMTWPFNSLTRTFLGNPRNIHIKTIKQLFLALVLWRYWQNVDKLFAWELSTFGILCILMVAWASRFASYG